MRWLLFACCLLFGVVRCRCALSVFVVCWLLSVLFAMCCLVLCVVVWCCCVSVSFAVCWLLCVVACWLVGCLLVGCLARVVVWYVLLLVSGVCCLSFSLVVVGGCLLVGD